MKNMSNIVVFDFETDGKNPHLCNPVQLAAVIINPRTLEIIPESEFSIDIKPNDMDKEEYWTNDIADTARWHANNYGVTLEQIKERWSKGTPEQTAWELFCKYLSNYGVGWKAPIAAGMNIREYDLIITKRLEEKYKSKPTFAKRDKIDILDFCFAWFENLIEPTSYALDNLRKFFGISKDGSHDAIKDVYDEARIIIKFLNLNRSISHKVKFKNSFFPPTTITTKETIES